MKYKKIQTGDKYGNWVVLDQNNFEQKKNYKKVLCQCQCINKTEKYVDERNLKNGSSTSCGKCFNKFINKYDKFGNWTVLENETNDNTVLCKCSCGTIKEVNKFNLNSGCSTNCGCISRNNHFTNNQYTNIGEEIIIGSKYNKWTVLEKVKTDSYLCECSCFYHTRNVLKRNELLSDSRHNGCKKCRLIKYHIGKIYGYLTILSIDEETSKTKNRIYVNAQCKCGDIHSYEQNSIIRGKVVSCGCKKHEIDESLLGKKFGKLTVTKLIGRFYDKSNKSYIKWECKCDCGNIKTYRQCNLTHGKIMSCGCINRSYGEQVIYNYLTDNEIIFEEQYRIDECRNILPLPFDFALKNENDKLIGLVEFDGKQHFSPYDFSGDDDNKAILNFQKIVENDKSKTNYCKNNHIPLLRISYEDLEDGNWIYLLWDFLYKLKLIVDIKEIA